MGADKHYEISIITPCHDIEREYFQNTFESLKNQSYGFQNIEWIVVAHNSEPDELAFIEGIVGGYDNVRIVTLEDEFRTASSPRNFGISLARGTYIGLLDADDAYELDCVEICLEVIKRHDADLLEFGREYFRAEEGVNGFVANSKFNATYAEYVYTRDTLDLDTVFEYDIWGFCTNVFFKKAFLAEAGLKFNTAMSFVEDFELMVRALMSCGKVCFLPQYVGYRYYMRQGSAIQISDASCERLISNAKCVDLLFTMLDKYQVKSTRARILAMFFLANYIVSSSKVDSETIDEIKNILGRHRESLKFVRIYGVDVADLFEQYALATFVLDCDTEDFFRLRDSGEGFVLLSAMKKMYTELHGILHTNEDCDYVARYDLCNDLSIDNFQATYPLTTVNEQQTFVQLMMKTGQRDVVVAGKVLGYAAFDEDGPMFAWPITRKNYLDHLNMYDEFIRAHRQALCLNYGALATNRTASGVPVGPACFFLNQSYCRLSDDAESHGSLPPSQLDLVRRYSCFKFALPKELILGGSQAEIVVCGLANRNVDFIVAPYLLAIEQFFDCLLEYKDQICAAIKWGDIREIDACKDSKIVIAPDPERAKEIEEALAEGPVDLAKRLWPQLTDLLVFDVTRVSNADLVRYSRIFHDVTVRAYGAFFYGSAIGFAVPDEINSYLLNTEGVFHEFIDRDHPGRKPLIATELEVGHSYEVVVTNNYGFYRCRSGIMITVTDFKDKIPVFFLNRYA